MCNWHLVLKVFKLLIDIRKFSSLQPSHCSFTLERNLAISRSDALRSKRIGFLLTFENPSVPDFQTTDLHVRSQRHGITKLGTLQSTHPVISTVNGEGQIMERTHLRHYVLIPVEWTADIRTFTNWQHEFFAGEYWSTV